MLALTAGLLLLAPAASQSPLPPPGSDWVLPPGTTNFATGNGPILVKSMTVPPGAYVRVSGPDAFVVVAVETISIAGVIDARGFDAKPVGTLLTPPPPSLGAPGGPAGAAGGDAFRAHGAVSAVGGAGRVSTASGAFVPRGGGGGESGVLPPLASLLGPVQAGGGGGAFGPDELGSASPGLVAEDGEPGHPSALGALSGAAPPQGGRAGGHAFVDGDPTNDFFGVKRDAATGAWIHGELLAPRGGSGGGASGATVPFAWMLTGQNDPYRFMTATPGGGGGGIVSLRAKHIEVLDGGAVVADGGAGTALAAGGIAYGGSGGGSGGMLMLQCETIDLTGATIFALSARGGPGGIGGPGATSSVGLGGSGGPGLIQVHVADPDAAIALPTFKGLSDLSSPSAHVLLPLP